MKNRLLFLLLTLSLSSTIMFFAGCTPSLNTPDTPSSGQATMITLETSPSFGDISEMRRTTLTLSQDGTMKKSVTAMQEDEPSLSENTSTALTEEQRYVDKNTLDHIFALATSREFLSLPEIIESDVLDGDYQYITVTVDDKSIRKGGLMPSEDFAAFKEVYSSMEDAWDKASQPYS